MTEVVDVTARQLEIFNFISAFIDEHGYPPTRHEISDAFNFSSDNAAEQHLRALEKKGAIRITRGISRGIVLLASVPPPQREAAHA